MCLKYLKSMLCLSILITLLLPSCKVSKSISLDDTTFEMVNREPITITKQKTIVINAMGGAGLALMPDVDFEKGVIEIQLKGENKAGQSFVGLAFNVQDEGTYEAIYFRPFNFLSDQKIRREHSIQYIYPPNYEWKKLRDEHEGVYEAEFPDAPDPDDWFTVKLDISPTTLKVIDSRSGKELLSVERLAKQQSNKIALWTGHKSKGAFQQLQLSHN